MQLSALDALHFYSQQFARKHSAANDTDLNGDLGCLLAISQGNSPFDFPRIQAVLAARAERIFPLRTVVSERPFALPFWIADPETASSRIREVPLPAAKWADALEVAQSLHREGIDPQQAAWRISVMGNVGDVPGIEGPATLVFLKLSHAITDGAGSARICRALFGDDVALATLTSETAAPSGTSRWESATALLGMPFRIGRTYRQLRALRKMGHTPPEPQTCVPIPALNNRNSHLAFLDVRFVPTAKMKQRGSITDTSITALSIALPRYLDDVGEPPSELAVLIPVVPRDRNAATPTSYRNTASASGLIRLPVDEPTADRINIVHEQIREAVRATSGPTAEAATAMFENLPAPLLRTRARQAVQASIGRVRANALLTTLHVGAADLQLLGQPVSFVVGMPSVGPRLGLAHMLMRLGDTTSICVVAGNQVPRPARYVENLDWAIQELGAASQDSR